MSNSENNSHSLAVIGLSCRFPGANNYEEFWNNLLLGKESIRHFSEEELLKAGIPKDTLANPNYIRSRGIIDKADYFDADFFELSENEVKTWDPQIRLFLECARNSLENAGYYSEERGRKIGIFAGQSQISSYLKEHILKNQRIKNFLGDYYVYLGNSCDFLTTKVSYKLNLTGPSYTLQTACSTSLVAIAEACQHLLDYQCDMALAGGVSLQFPLISGYWYEEGMILSPDGHCRAFDEKANGTVPSSGVGVVTLKRYEDAIADEDHIYAIVKGFAVNNDGRNKVGYTAPSVQGQASVIQEAIALAHCELNSIGYIEAHGTGTALGDPTEIEALKSIFPANTAKKCAIGSVKTNIGHCDIASGVAGFIKTVLALYYKKIPATLHFNKINKLIDLENTPFFINSDLLEWQENQYPRRAGVSSFGIGGTNAHVVLEENTFIDDDIAEGIKDQNNEQVLLPLSAKNKESLEKIKDNLIKFIERSKSIHLLDIAYTHQIGREPFKHRCFFVLNKKEVTLKQLHDPLSNNYHHFSEEKPPKIVFLFPGQGSEIKNCFEIYQKESIFQTQMTLISQYIQSKLHLNLEEWLFPKTKNKRKIDLLKYDFMLQQLCLFAQAFSLAKLWMHWGILPDVMLGHSLGEYVAACLSEVISIEEAIDILIFRSQYLQSIPDGKMVVVQLEQDQIKPYLTGSLSIAANNAKNIHTLSGDQEEVLQLMTKLKADGVAYKEILTTKPFHSSILEIIKKPFSDSIRHIVGKPPIIPYFSNITGRKITPDEVYSSEYWANHMCETVKFYEAMSSLKESNFLFLDINCSGTLSNLVKNKKSIKSSVCISSIDLTLSSLGMHESLLRAMGKLWIHGATPLWKNFKQEKTKRIPLPTYPFSHKRYCIDSLPDASSKKQYDGHYVYEPFWERKQQIDNLAEEKERKTRKEKKSSILIFHDKSRFSLPISEYLSRVGREVIDVYYGDKFLKNKVNQYFINGMEISQCDHLIKSISEERHIDSVIFFPAIMGEKHKIGVLPDYFLYAFNAIQSINKFFHKEKICFSIIANQVWRVCCNEYFDPLKSILIGIPKTLFYDIPEIKVKIVDVDDLDLCDRDELVSDLLFPHSESISYRHGKRFSLSYKQILFNDINGTELFLKENGTYLITGGLGGIGLSMADEFSRVKPINMILVQRSFFPSKNEWDTWIKTHEMANPISQKIKILKSILARGSQITIFQADVANKKQMQKVFSSIKKDYSRINGIIHAAGIPDGNLFQLQTHDNLKNVMSSKIEGSVVLNTILKREDVDFILLCSALVAVTGGPGQLGYCSANNFLDSFAQACANQKNRVLSINWDLWQETGMALNASKIYEKLGHKDLLSHMGLNKSDNVHFLAKALSCQMPQFIISSDSLPERIEKYKKISDEYLNRNFSDLYKNESIEPIENLENHTIFTEISKLFSIYLGEKEIQGDTNFFDHGGDSLLAIRLADSINKKTQVKIYPHHIQQFPNPAALTTYVLKQLNLSRSPLKPKDASLPFSLIPLQKGNEENFLFLIHPVGGTFYIYRDLIKNLPKQLTVYGIQAESLNRNRVTYTSIKGMASNYAQMIKSVQPKGPYFLGGFSFGGIVAYEIAQQLSKLGLEVKMIVMLDSPHYKAIPKTFLDNAEIISYLLGVGSGYMISSQDLRKLNKEEQIQFFLQHSDKITNAVPSTQIDIMEHFFNIFKCNSKAMSDYIPKQYFGETKIFYFKAFEKDPINPPNPELGWVDLLGDQIEVHSVPGNHITMMFEPNIQAAGFVLSNFFNQKL